MKGNKAPSRNLHAKALHEALLRLRVVEDKKKKEPSRKQIQRWLRQRGHDPA